MKKKIREGYKKNKWLIREKLEEMKIQITKYEIDKEEAFENKEKLAKFYNKWIINLDQEYNEY